MVDFLSNFFNNFIDVIFYLISLIINLVLTPINLIIDNYLPNVQEAIDFLNDSVDYIFNIVEWLCSFLGFSQLTWSIIFDLLGFIIIVPPLAFTIRVCVNWYNKLKVG